MAGLLRARCGNPETQPARRRSPGSDLRHVGVARSIGQRRERFFSRDPLACRGSISKLSQVSDQGGDLFGFRDAVEVGAVRGGNRRKDACRRRGLYLFEEFDVVIDDLFQCRRTIVVKIGSGLSDTVESRDVEFVPVVARRRPPDEARQQRAARVRAGAADFRSVGECELIGSYLLRKTGGTWLEYKPCRRNRIHGFGTGGDDVGEPRHNRRLRGRAPGAAMALRTRPDEDRLALLFERGEGRVGIGKGCNVVAYGVRERPHSRTAEKGQLKRGKVVQYYLSRRPLHLGVIDEGP